VVSGEERELCRRIGEQGLRVVRVGATMAHHDIHMDEFGQWWIRAKRSGFTSAEHLLDRRIMGRNVLSILTWGAGVPAVALGMALPTFGGSLMLLWLYAVLWYRVRKDRLLRGASESDASLYAFATVLGKVPEAVGIVEFGRKRGLRQSLAGLRQVAE
jgi:hypothetical protein